MSEICFTPRSTGLNHYHGGYEFVTSDMDERVRQQIEANVFSSTRAPRRYGEPGENLGTIDTLEPGTSAVPLRAEDGPDIRQERRAHKAEMARSRAIIIASATFGVPGPDDFVIARLISTMGRGSRVLQAADVAPTSAVHKKQLFQGVGRREALAYDGWNSTPLRLADDIDGITGTSSEVARRIRNGEIGVNMLGDEMFERAYRLRAGTLDGVDETVAFAYGESIYLRRSSGSLLPDTVHEGKHSLDFLDGFSGTTQQWERRAWFAEREYLGRLGLPSPHRNSRQLMLDIWRTYPHD